MQWSETKIGVHKVFAEDADAARACGAHFFSHSSNPGVTAM